jgi:hypothetical protein
MTDDELAPQAHEIDSDHRIGDTPSDTALLHRKAGGYREVMWINGYPAVRYIIVTTPEVVIAPGVTMPGVVREIPIGYRDVATRDAFKARFEKVVGSYLAMGWERKTTAVYSGDPWDFEDPTDRPCSF